jgi:hypothetical protein
VRLQIAAGVVATVVAMAGCRQVDPRGTARVAPTRPPDDKRARQDAAPEEPSPGSAAPSVPIALDGGAVPVDDAAMADGPLGAADAADATTRDAVVPAPDVPPLPTLAQGLVAHWRFDEGGGLTAADATINANAATLRNGVGWIPSAAPGARPGDFALELDGIDDMVTAPAFNVPRIEEPKSVAFWIAAAPRPMPTGPSPRSTCVALLNIPMRAALQLGTDRGRPAVWQWGQTEALVANGIAPGYHHVAYTYDGTVHRLYVDGVLAVTSSLPSQRGPTALVSLGTYMVPSEMCAGQLDDLRIYNRPLTPPEVLGLVNRAGG